MLKTFELIIAAFPEEDQAATVLGELRNEEADKTFAIFNNCYGDYGIKNAKTLMRLMQ